MKGKNIFFSDINNEVSDRFSLDLILAKAVFL